VVVVVDADIAFFLEREVDRTRKYAGVRKWRFE